MPLVITFDIKNANNVDYNQLQSMFERFGFENLGGSAYRYPQLGTLPHTEDWFNHVIPALMMFRAYALKSGKEIRKLTIDTQTSTGYVPLGKFGTAHKKAKDIKFYDPKNKQFGLKNLRKWIDDIGYPY